MPGDANSKHAEPTASPHPLATPERVSLLGKLAEASPVGLYWIEAGRCTFVNPALCTITGLARTAALSGGWYQAVHPEDLARARAEWLAAAGSGQTFSSEYRCVHPDGRIVWVLSQARCVDSANSTYVGTLTDISARKRIEQVLREREQQLNAAQRLANMGSWEQDLRTDVVSYSEQVAAIFELNSAELPPSEAGLLSRVHPEDRGLVSRTHAEALASRKPYRLEHRLQMADGRVKHVERHGELAFDESGQPRSLRTTIQDVTQQRNATLKLEASEARYHSMVAALSEGIVVYEQGGIATTWNRAAEHILGSPEGPFQLVPVGATWPAFHPDGTEFTRETHPILRVLQSGVPEANVVMGVHVANHELRWLTINVVPIIDPGSVTPVSVVASFVDITERLKAERGVRQSLAENRLLLSELHHRMKNNLQVVSSLLKWQAARTQDPNAQALFDESYERVRSIATVHQLLSANNHNRVDFKSYLRLMTAELVSAHRSPGLQVEVVVSAEGVLLDIREAVPCGLIVNELVTNAIKHAFPIGRSGKVTISMTSNAELTILEVADDGVGLPEDVDLDAPKTLGLTLVKALSQQLSARLHVARGHGTRFTLTF
ncbi:MAG: PAS domain-containing protein [Polyangiaceae bacterium]|nr:PAS domain-containing protein [Polyangiaceae bacterium]